MSLEHIRIGARSSNLSVKQVAEVMKKISFGYTTTFLKTSGDRNLSQSIKEMDKTDFFTKEVDQLVIKGLVDVGIHSAKDLPYPLPKELTIFALTKSISARDCLVLRNGETIESLKKNACIGSSSLRRDKALKKIRPDLRCVEVRGTIEMRLKLLDQRKVDGIIIAEAALIRLGLNHLNKIYLRGFTAPLQGQLAIVGRVDRLDLKPIFRSIDSRSNMRTVHFGLTPKKKLTNIHYHPLIKIVPKKYTDLEILDICRAFKEFSYIIFTSKVSVKLLFEFTLKNRLQYKDFYSKRIVAVGPATAKQVEEYGVKVDETALEHTQEGIVSLLSNRCLKGVKILLPQSSLSRKGLFMQLTKRGAVVQRVTLYETIINTHLPKINIDNFDKYIFTSPSTVDAFVHFFKKIPFEKTIISQGPVTESRLLSHM